MKKHILVVDDEANISELLAEILNANGYRATAVASGAEALQVCRREAPDLVISDLQLEDADGLELIAKMKEGRPDLPVILLTGVLFEPAVVSAVLSKKVSCYLEKTSSLEKVLEAVGRLLSARPSNPSEPS